MENFQEIIQPFYSKSLSVNAETTPSFILNQYLAEDFESISSKEIKSRDVLVKQISYFWQLIPDLKWDIQEMLVSGNRVTVRSIATGAPKGNFFGIECDGSKSFKIDTIDIHTIEGGKVIRTYHVEDWASAFGQLK